MCSGLFPEGFFIAFTAYKILLCLILLGLSFFSSHLSVGFCVLWVSISTLHSSSPEDSSRFCSPFTGEGCWNYLHRTSRRAGGKTPINPLHSVQYSLIDTLIRFLMKQGSSLDHSFTFFLEYSLWNWTFFGLKHRWIVKAYSLLRRCNVLNNDGAFSHLLLLLNMWVLWDVSNCGAKCSEKIRFIAFLENSQIFSEWDWQRKTICSSVLLRRIYCFNYAREENSLGRFFFFKLFEKTTWPYSCFMCCLLLSPYSFAHLVF